MIRNLLLLSYYKLMLVRNPKCWFYFYSSFFFQTVAIGFLAFFQSKKIPYFYFHELFIVSFLFQFFYNHFYYGLGWESSFKYFVLFHIGVKRFILVILFLNFLCFIYSIFLIEVLSVSPWVKISYDFLNTIIIYFLIPNLLFVFVFPMLTVYIDLFDAKKMLVIHKFYTFPLLAIVVAIPAVLQHAWLNFMYGPELVCCFAFFLTLVVILGFPRLIALWEGRLMEVEQD